MGEEREAQEEGDTSIIMDDSVIVQEKPTHYCEVVKGLLKVPWTARSNQSILRAINPEYSLEGLMLKLKLQYFGHLMYTDDSLERSLMLGKIEGRGEEGVRG